MLNKVSVNYNVFLPSFHLFTKRTFKMFVKSDSQVIESSESILVYLPFLIFYQFPVLQRQFHLDFIS